jgi:uncharacterized RDD family membrane protein YckC
LTNDEAGGESVVHGQADADKAAPVVDINPSVTDPQATESAAEEPVANLNAESWRAEVAARLERYRTRRKPRTPRYPSLLLPFDAPESWVRPTSASRTAAATAALRVERDLESIIEAQPEAGRVPRLVEPYPNPAAMQVPGQSPYAYPEQSAKVIEFPRSAAIPIFRPSDLADPVVDHARPRIVEAPEILPPPPALGGILIDPVQGDPAERRADSVFASPCATVAQRGLAALIDGVVVLLSLTAFATLVFRLNLGMDLDHRMILPLVAGAGIVAVLLGAAYKFLFVVYTGATPGWRVARLQLEGFDGSAVNRRTRRWRVLASFLSAFSAGLGYLWCILDQDGLGWHDRITRTHVTSVAKKEAV